jgi:hypothetical protein
MFAGATIVAFPARGVTQSASISDDSVRAAVQRFYDWYVPVASRVEGPAWMEALARKQFTFAPVLVEALRADSVAQAKSDDDEEGLDGDPFLNAQDPCRRYVARAVRHRGTSYLVDVLGSGGCAKHTTPDVVVEVVPQGGKLVFVNFHYPDDESDLVAVLKNLHPDA